MTPSTGILVLGGGHISYIVKMHYFFKKSSFSLRNKTYQEYSNVDQGKVYQNCKFHDPQDRGSCAMAWPNKSYSEIALFVLHVNLLLYSGAWFRQSKNKSFSEMHKAT